MLRKKRKISFVNQQKIRLLPWLVMLTILLSSSYSFSQIVINEIFAGGTVELKNIGNSTVDVSNYWLCDFPSYQRISNLNLECGNTNLEAGGILTVNNFNVVDGADGEMGLYTTNSFGSSTALIDYVEWGSSGHQRSSVAIAAGIWTLGDFVPAFSSTESLAYSGTGETAASWTASANTSICQENTMACDAEGGMLTGGPFEFNVGDGVADMLAPGSITLTNNTGSNSQWVVTDEDGLILGLPPMPSVVDFDGAGPGICLVWHLSYEDGIEGLAAGENANDLAGCFSLSNPVSVIRTDVSTMTNGGTIAGGPFEFCVGDGEVDNVSGITLTGNTGTNSQWVITDDQGLILGLPPMPGVVDFDVAGPGVCLIWHLSYEDDITGLAAGENTANFGGTFSLSNSISVTRNQPEGGTLTGGPFEFDAVGDGTPDMIPAGAITLTNNSGQNSQWIVTDASGNILGLPPMPSVVDFDGAGFGDCLIYHLSYDDGIVGLAPGQNIADLEGCHSISNSILVARTTADGCLANGGMLNGGPFEFDAVGDGTPDMIPAGSISLINAAGQNSQWIVTDASGNILGLPPMPSVVDFDGAGFGDCLIYHLSFDDGIVGLAPGQNIADLEGCHSISNSILVARTTADGCLANGGMLNGGPFEFNSVGDGTPDMIPAGSISLINAAGQNSQWIVTDASGNILGLPPMPSVVDFDGAGVGVCFVYHLSYDDGIEGLAAGQNIADFEGCHSLSNGIAVTRTESSAGVDLELDITVDDSSYERYEEVAYTITITNNGSETATDVVVSAGLPSGLVYTDDQVSQGDYNLFFEEWTVGTLAAGATAELELTLFTLIEGVDVVNFVQVINASGDDVDSTPDNNDTEVPQEDDEAAVVISEFGGTGEGDIDLELSLVADQNTYDIYENVTYTVTVTNNGTDAASNILIAAGLPDGMVYTAHAESTGDYNLFFETWTIPSLAAGETAELDLVLFTLVENQSITQFVEVLAANENDDDSTPGNGNGVSPQEDDEAAITIEFANSLVANAATRTGQQVGIQAQALYPNPAVEVLNFSFETVAETALSVRVFDITGQLKLDIPVDAYRGVNQLTLDISNLTAGTYFVKMEGATINERPLQFVKIN